MSHTEYPRRRVFLAFLLCPFVLGFVGGVIKTITLLAHLVNTPKLLGEVRGGELVLMPFLAPFLAQLIFFLPFLFFATVITLLRVRRTAMSCFLVALSGASIATGWVLCFVLLVVRDTDIKGGGVSDYLIELSGVFFASLATCWFAARLFLPRKSSHTPSIDD
ncbi:hypothetical protein JFT86_27315 [Pseudomonas sp. TH06]|uniref:hypothetical protein n=2 Tax=unclassified Pseudomonas TaxID=196821 RepID=UPI0019141BBE|nr:hypothetical protein [Pseudomonas sp. TH06]MBK5530647.1 hypothetical protein [Pseudomonas sp. TH06]